MNFTDSFEPAKATDETCARALALIAEMIQIADGVSEKDEVPVAKLKIEVRQWVVESYLLKVRRKAEDEAAPGAFAVNIHTSADLRQGNLPQQS